MIAKLIERVLVNGVKTGFIFPLSLATALAAEQNLITIETVLLPSGIRMAKYEITQDQWQTVMAENPSNFHKCGGNCPVELVSWEDVQRFITKLNRQTNLHYRLPTETEWLVACQAGEDSEYCGSNQIDEVAWYDQNSGNTTQAVGQKQANAWGLHDMSGNVWEWTDSCWDEDCSLRVFRGGSWLTSRALVSATLRRGNIASLRSHVLGFRLVLQP
jgi:formylglycine-generating enzyme required for sulfatase activity